MPENERSYRIPMKLGASTGRALATVTTLAALALGACRTSTEDVNRWTATSQGPKKLVAVLIQADRFGTSIAQSLRGHADFMRTQSRQVAEEKAAKLGVKLVFPIFFCILPSLFIVTVGPVAVKIIRELLPMMDSV